MDIHVDLGESSYNICISRGILSQAATLIDLERKVLIVTDDGVPSVYAETLKKQCSEGYIVTIPQGEKTKSIQTFESLLSEMLHLGFTRADCVAAVGGGVVGDLAGFTAACYMRGVDFYNIPTTVLAQVDSSVGGKTAVNLNGVKNIVGAFYQPKKVLIDPELLSTLPQRQISNGLAEALKMSLTSDTALFDIFETGNIAINLEEIIRRSVIIKKTVVEQDEKEAGLRRILNFGHTIGHAIESAEAAQGLYHGECVALGMLPMMNDELRERVIKIYEKLSLPISIAFNTENAMDALLHDKKSCADVINATYVIHPGKYIPLTLMPQDFIPLFEIIRKR